MHYKNLQKISLLIDFARNILFNYKSESLISKFEKNYIKFYKIA